MHHVPGVQGHHPPSHLGQGVPEPALIRPFARPNVRHEVAPVEQVEGDEPLGSVALEGPQPDQVRVGDVGQGAKLPLEPVERVPVDGGERLQGDPVAPGDVNRLEDHAHSPSPQFAHEAVVAQAVRGQMPGERRVRRFFASGGPRERKRRLQEDLPDQGREPRQVQDVFLGPRTFALAPTPQDLILEQVAEQGPPRVVG